MSGRLVRRSPMAMLRQKKKYTNWYVWPNWLSRTEHHCERRNSMRDTRDYRRDEISVCFFCILHSKVGWHSAPYFFSNEIWHQPKRKTSKILSSMDMKAFRINGISFIESILEVNQRWMQHRLADSSARCQCLPIMCLNRHENNASQRQKMYRFDGGGLNLIKILL